MWVFTKKGFFSVVHDDFCRPGELVVRARHRADLVRLIAAMGGNERDTPIKELRGADYRFRIYVTNLAWAEYLVNEAVAIDYDNVKSAIVGSGDIKRHNAYMQVWSALSQWQAAINNKGKGSR
jgi:hypothetical protein